MTTYSKGGTFAPADMSLVDKALRVYLNQCLEYEKAEGGAHEDTRKIVNLQHRLKRIGGNE